MILDSGPFGEDDHDQSLLKKEAVSQDLLKNSRQKWFVVYGTDGQEKEVGFLETASGVQVVEEKVYPTVIENGKAAERVVSLGQVYSWKLGDIITDFHAQQAFMSLSGQDQNSVEDDIIPCISDITVKSLEQSVQSTLENSSS